MRSSNRESLQARAIKIIPDFIPSADGSVLIEAGSTRVICTVSIENTVPSWMKNNKTQRSWLSAEYAMLPAATGKRTRRERPSPSGRSQEIQRLIGRSLRSVVDFKLFSDKTFLVDCDVIQADGGTRSAAITGASVALQIAAHRCVSKNHLDINPVMEHVACMSVGLKADAILVDLDYQEDSNIDVDMNISMTASGKLIEVQGTGEKATFTNSQMQAMVEAASQALKPIFMQQRALVSELLG